MRTLSLLFAALLLSGCFYSRDIARTQHDIQRQYPSVRFEREVVVTLGAFSLGFAGLVSGIIPDDNVRIARDMLGDVRRVKVGVFRAEGLTSLDGLQLPAVDRFRRNGWEVAARVMDDEQVTWVLYRERGQTVRDVYVVALSTEELVLVEFNGDLNALLAKALDPEHGFVRARTSTKRDRDSDRNEDG